MAQAIGLHTPNGPTADTVPGQDFSTRRRDVLGVGVHGVEPAEAITAVLGWARDRRPALVDFMAVHALVTAAREPAYRRMLGDFDLVAPDGQPVRWALNWFHRLGLGERVYGPATMLRLCEAAAVEGLAVYLYGSKPETLAAMEGRLLRRCPGLRVVGREPSKFRPLTEEEDRDLVQRINDSGAQMVFLGLGCPRQEIFAHEHRGKIEAVQLCVGAAFDFHAGAQPMAPPWMQRRGLEWLYRLTREPRRLWRRYLVTNALFLWMAAGQGLCRLRGSSDG